MAVLASDVLPAVLFFFEGWRKQSLLRQGKFGGVYFALSAEGAGGSFVPRFTPRRASSAGAPVPVRPLSARLTAFVARAPEDARKPFAAFRRRKPAGATREVEADMAKVSPRWRQTPAPNCCARAASDLSFDAPAILFFLDC